MKSETIDLTTPTPSPELKPVKWEDFEPDRHDTSSVSAVYNSGVRLKAEESPVEGESQSKLSREVSELPGECNANFRRTLANHPPVQGDCYWHPLNGNYVSAMEPAEQGWVGRVRDMFPFPITAEDSSTLVETAVVELVILAAVLRMIVSAESVTAREIREIAYRDCRFLLLELC